MQLYKERRTKDSVDVKLILTIFRFKEELPSKIGTHTDAISIWTENVSAAKSFVMNMMVISLIFLDKSFFPRIQSEIIFKEKS